jgi:hypothetical protein
MLLTKHPTFIIQTLHTCANICIGSAGSQSHYLQVPLLPTLNSVASAIVVGDLYQDGMMTG